MATIEHDGDVLDEDESLSDGEGEGSGDDDSGDDDSDEDDSDEDDLNEEPEAKYGRLLGYFESQAETLATQCAEFTPPNGSEVEKLIGHNDLDDDTCALLKYEDGDIALNWTILRNWWHDVFLFACQFPDRFDIDETMPDFAIREQAVINARAFIGKVLNDNDYDCDDDDGDSDDC